MMAMKQFAAGFSFVLMTMKPSAATFPSVLL
jgi:hypothetical protein